MRARRLDGRINRWRSLAVAATLLVAGLGLGLVGSPSAIASCVGPQLALAQDGSPIVAQPGSTSDAAEVYPVSRAVPLHVAGTNLTFECHDTYSGTPGCDRPVPAPPAPPAPISNAEFELIQNGRHWRLGSLGVVGSDLSAASDLRFPADAGPGPAVLLLTDRANPSGVQLNLLLR